MQEEELEGFLTGSIEATGQEQEQSSEAANTQEPNDQQQATGDTPETQEVEGESAPPSTDSETRQVPLPALQETREKLRSEREARQQLERQLADMQRRIESIQAQGQQQQPQQADELTEDKFYENPVSAIKHVQKQFDERLAAERLTTSVALARQMHQDYDDVISKFDEVSKRNPGLVEAVQKSPTPALDAYRAVKQDLERSDPEAQNRKIEAEVNKRLEDRLKQEMAKLSGRQAAENVPKSISAARGSGAATAQGTWSGPPSMDAILNGG